MADLERCNMRPPNDWMIVEKFTKFVEFDDCGYVEALHRLGGSPFDIESTRAFGDDIHKVIRRLFSDGMVPETTRKRASDILKIIPKTRHALHVLSKEDREFVDEFIVACKRERGRYKAARTILEAYEENQARGAASTENAD